MSEGSCPSGPFGTSGLSPGVTQDGPPRVDVCQKRVHLLPKFRFFHSFLCSELCPHPYIHAENMLTRHRTLTFDLTRLLMVSILRVASCYAQRLLPVSALGSSQDCSWRYLGYPACNCGLLYDTELLTEKTALPHLPLFFYRENK